MKAPHIGYLVLFYLIPGPITVCAQEEAPAEERPTLQSLSLYDDTQYQENPFYIQTDDGYEPLRITRLRRGPQQYPIFKGDSLQIFQKKTTPDGETWEPSFTIPLPSRTISTFLMIFTDPGTPPILLDDSASAHPPGSIRMLNTTPFQLIGLIGEYRFDLGAKQDYVQRIDSDILTPIRLAVSHEGEWIPIKSITTRVRPDRRLLCLGRFVNADGDVYFDMTPIQDVIRTKSN